MLASASSRRDERRFIPIHLTPFLLVLVVFAFMVIYFTRMHPLYIADTDDWTYIGCWRRAVPMWRDWNPTRVLPEILMPTVGAIGAFVVTPLIGDYIDAQMITAGVAVSLAITAYAMVFYFVAHRYLRQDRWVAALLALFFLSLHFLVFRSAPTDNQHLFHSINLTTYFYYTIPNMLNASLALLYACGFWGREGMVPRGRPREGLMLLLAYLALLSNLYASVILAACVGSSLVIRLVRAIKRHDTILVFTKRNLASLTVILCWFLVLFFEANGGRAASLQSDVPLTTRLLSTFSYMGVMSKTVSRVWILTVCICLGTGAVILFRHHGDHLPGRTFEAVLVLLLSAVLSTAYLSLACSSVSPDTILRADVVFGIFFPIIATATCCLALPLAYAAWAKAFLPLVVFILACNCNTQGRTFVDPYILTAPANSIRKLDQEIVEQYVSADLEGKDSVEVVVPKLGASDNFPLAVYGSEKISNTLVAHRIINRDVTATFAPSEEKTIEMGISK